jgi:ADP-ribose pyrophosphatase YjhB (NUDIX family)
MTATDHHGVDVPPALRPWSASWPAYAPVDITPRELRDPVVDAAWIVDHQTDPTEVTDWPARQTAAVVPFDVDDNGCPQNPAGRTNRRGRNLGAWGENAAADPVVLAGVGAARRVLLIRRGDVGQWAIPGGMVDPGETAPATLVRELAEETGVDLAGMTPTILARTYVDDWRNTDWAWVCSTVALYQLDDAPEATAGDDATDAAWWPAADVDTLTAALTAEGVEMYPAHRTLLAGALASDRGAQ